MYCCVFPSSYVTTKQKGIYVNNCFKNVSEVKLMCNLNLNNYSFTYQNKKLAVDPAQLLLKPLMWLLQSLVEQAVKLLKLVWMV